ncbi:vWA domain-containing protein [uncultured Albimonas sp.]|uniref:vWA domain-containing protein n=1 Tax=uncultured Albimonas sp. TaxID=1331701 RepID=UPI0030EB7E9B|tara:strand:+ start:5984 stop:8029 length:2046 start_codon:yes stop_codon:yes gene_type:complete
MTRGSRHVPQLIGPVPQPAGLEPLRALRVLLGLLAAFGCLLAAPAPARAETPLVMEGKETLPQRVLTRTEAARRSAPGETPGATVPPMVQLFVFERAEADGEEWLRVAAAEAGDDAFWLPASETIEWRQNIVLIFEQQGGLERLLVFEHPDDLYEVIESERPDELSSTRREDAVRRERGDLPPGGPVIALGPRDGVDLSSQFYFLPILDWEPAIFEESGARLNALRVAVVRDTGEDPAPDAPPRRQSNRKLLKDFKVGIVFLVDTTTSMGPFIEATRDAVAEMYDRLRASRLGDQIRFGLVGYRDSLDAAPQAGYLTEVFVPVSEGGDRDRFMSGMSRMHASSAPTRHFREDAYSGVMAAVDDLAASGLDAGWVVLVTDAAPREAGDQFSGTGLSGRGLGNYARERGIAIATMHLLTPGGARSGDHADAESSYRGLTEVPNVGDLYFPVAGGDPGRFQQAAIQVSSEIADDLARNAYGERVTPDDGPGEREADAHLIDRVGRVAAAMRLAYLGRVKGESAPDVFSGWIADRDFDKVGLRPVSMRLLLTRNQLSDLEQSLQSIFDKGLEGAAAPDQFFRQVVAAAADMSRRPDIVGRRAENLAEAGLIAEYLEGLPYKSAVMNITERDWIRMNPSQQLTFLTGVQERAERYRRFNASPELWVEFERGETTESYYPMLLDDLP